jgi:hypothetical protein
MPAAARYSAATKELVAELRARGYKVGCRAPEYWAERGLAPAPVRRSLGRRGSVSSYPAGAVEQYVAVASVMRSGMDWRVSGLLLIGQGYLPARETTFRLLLEFLLPDDIDSTDDPLERAENEIKEMAQTPLFERLDQIISRNLSLARIVDPVTKKEIPIESAVPGVMSQIFAAMLGAQLPEGAAEEIAGAWGLIGPKISEEERLELINYVEAVFAGALTFSELARATSTISPARLQSYIVDIRQLAAEHPIDVLKFFSAPLVDIWMIIIGLAISLIEDLGGLAWFQSMGVFND